jgi:hypothetical protein
MNAFERACALFALMLALALAGCGSARHSSISAPDIQPASSSVVNPQVAEVLAAPAPEGVDAALWDTLKNELANELGQQKAGSQATEEDLPEWDQTFFYCWGRCVNGIRLVTWDSRFFKGDGSQNGVVDIADLATLARHFGKSVEANPEAAVADYNRDGTVGIADISVLAINFGKACSGFKVEVSEEARRSGYAILATIGFTDWSEIGEDGFATYEYDFPSGLATSAWARVTAYDADNKAIAYDISVVLYDDSEIEPWHWRPPYFPIDDLAMFPTTANSVTWTSEFFVGNGSGNIWVFNEDISTIASYFGEFTSVNPHAMSGDYDQNGVVDMLDLDAWLDHYNELCAGFLVEVSIVGPASGFVEDGSPTFGDCVKEGWNDFGFRDFEYTLQSPPEAPSYWVRVTPYCEYSSPRLFGLPSAAVEIVP